jgi:hypothetical protein
VLGKIQTICHISRYLFFVWMKFCSCFS